MQYEVMPRDSRCIHNWTTSKVLINSRLSFVSVYRVNGKEESCALTITVCFN